MLKGRRHHDHSSLPLCPSSIKVRQYFTDPSFFAFDAGSRGVCTSSEQQFPGDEQRDWMAGGVAFACEAFAPSAATVKVKQQLIENSAATVVVVVNGGDDDEEQLVKA